MIKYILRRVALLVPVLLGVTLITFTLLYMTPGDPATAILGEAATKEAAAQLREEMGFNDPFIVQYFSYLKKLIFQFDLGNSYITHAPVLKSIMEAFPATLRLAFYSVLIAVILGIPMGIISAVKPYSIFDNITLILGLVGISMPVFWLGLLLILFFSVQLRVLPASGFSSFKHMILPAISLSAQSIAVIMRMTRSSMLEVIRKDYIRTARAKGQKRSIVIIKHALRNALIPIITIIGLQFGQLLGGAVLTESIFAIPGIGRLMVDAIKMRDFPIVQGGVLFVAITFSFVNLFVDILYSYADPKIKAQFK